MELPPAEAASLLSAMTDAERAAKVLSHATVRTAVAVARTDPGLARRVVAYLPEPYQSQVGRVISDGC